MDKFQSSYEKYVNKHQAYKIACTKCKQLYIKNDDEPFVCLSCTAR